MLTKCLVTPLKLAKHLDWNSRLGRLGAIMCVDISNHQIGIACAYRRHQPPATRLQPDDDGMFPASSATTITPLPPLPYLSSEAYHASYAFLNNSPGRKERSSDRVDRSFEIADQLAQIACKRGVHGVLVRWPGDLASTIFPNNTMVEQVPVDDITEGHLTMSLEERLLRGSGTSTPRSEKSDGCQGYLRGRILYLLDKCCTSRHDENKISSEPLLIEGTRPFALLDTSISEQNFTIYYQQSKYLKPPAPRLPKVQDTYGNSFMEADHFGRVPIFGNQPPPPKQGKHYYSSRERYYGYKVSTHFGTGDGNSSPNQTAMEIDRRPNDEPLVAIMQGSLAAMHVLYEFADKYLEGAINLPRWATASPRRAESNTGCGSQAGQRSNDSSPERKPPNAAAANTNKAPSTLIQMPKKRTRRRTRQK
mmetsp:Transcript_3197/g.7175  ORF Transcript_3197/g.7175 Transcript_3197/m.7175 type:complete len:421 (-) Transcript_3197:405-1667(-)